MITHHRPESPGYGSFPDQLAGVNPLRLLYHGHMSEKEDTLLEFPCDFPIKAMGRCETGFEAKALEIVRRHAPDFDDERMRLVASKRGNYLSVTFTIQATSREQLDNLYRELTACDELLMVF